MPFRVEIGPVFPDEVKRQKFDFTEYMADGETISSYVTTCTVYSGEDPTPENVIFAAATLDGFVVSQLLSPVLPGLVYYIECTAVTNQSQTIKLYGYLAVPPAFDEETSDQVPVADLIVASYDSGPVTGEIATVTLLNAAQTLAGGTYQLNTYITILNQATSGQISARTNYNNVGTGTLKEVLSNVLVSAEDLYSANTQPLEISPGTPITIETEFLSVVGTPTYQLTATLLRL